MYGHPVVLERVAGALVAEADRVLDAGEQDLPQGQPIHRERVDVWLAERAREQVELVVEQRRVHVRAARGGQEQLVELGWEVVRETGAAVGVDVDAVTLLPGNGLLVAFVDSDVDSGSAQSLSEAQPAKTGTDDDDMRKPHGAPSLSHDIAE